MKQDLQDLDLAYKRKLECQKSLQRAVQTSINKDEVVRLRERVEHFAKEYSERHAAIQRRQLGGAANSGGFRIENNVIDLHGMTLSDAKEFVRRKIQNIQDSIDSGNIIPNIGDRQNHVLKVVTGRGEHSANTPVLRINIPPYIRD